MRNIFLSCFRQKINYHSNSCKIVAPNALFSLSQKLQGVIPVLRHWDLFFKPIGFLHYLLSFQCMTLEPVFFFFWIPVSRTGMTMSATQITYKSQCSYSCASRAGMILKGGLLVFHVNNGYARSLMTRFCKGIFFMGD